jgi:MinD superfamily P-loop ATPase
LRTYTRAFTTMAKNKKTIAVLSGKGGTGKTLLSVNLAAAAQKITGHSLYIDCDVEEPNGHLFFQPENTVTEKVCVKIPCADEALCVGCRKCVDICNFNALAFVKNRPMLFDEICHSCAGCVIVCPQDAMREKDREIGHVTLGWSQGVRVVTGEINPGEASGVPVIKRLLMELPETGYTFIDCPPGSACIVMESIKEADFCVLAAEPTVFGAHNLAMVHELVEVFNKPFGVLLNKCQEENPVGEYCAEKGIDILGRIPFDRQLGKINSQAQIAARVREDYFRLFSSLLDSIDIRLK